ncbi:ABC transporter ATP-binding protein [Paracoccus alkanivorans]|uniref:ABC transporter ATP-binding protein n=1 Tax=Paracoccus alkanivorans TaxID=2116655 RepID=A0A3M0M7A8_9RHOB|nr:ABC transporter ATP-binding protein [Paracoccus alkanivorans]RMC32354.1 ABC transporter ATP-binding protein [Paracoccus alkanivorans]
MASGSTPLFRLIRAGRPSVTALIAATLAAAAGVACSLVFPLLTRKVVDTAGSGGLISETMSFLIAALLGATLFNALSSLLLARIGHNIVANLRQRLSDKMLRLTIPAFDREGSGERVSRIMRDCESISALTTTQTVNLITGTMMLIGVAVVLYSLDNALTMTLLGAMIAAFAVLVPLSMLLDGLSRRTQDEAARLSGLLTQVFGEIRLVKAFTAEERESRRIGKALEKLRRLGMRSSTVNTTLEPVIQLAMTAAIVTILIYGASRVSVGTMSVGTLTAFILSILNVISPLMQLTMFMAEFQRAKGASARIAVLLDETEEEYLTSDPAPAEGGELRFEHVSFAYQADDGDRQPVLQDLSLAFAPGSTTALVGPSGSGKSTILSLIERFYLPSEGRITLNGTDIARIPLQDWRRMIGYVPQNAPIMPGSMRDNITYGLTGNFTDDQIRDAAARADALSFIETLPRGLDTNLIEQGNNLSGGQRQRIAIARMFLRDPRILILDEATSALDGETESQVKASLDRLRAGRTNIVVAHRLSTVFDADLIVFLEGGQVSGSGTHAELVATHEFYARLVGRQNHAATRPAAALSVPLSA